MKFALIGYGKMGKVIEDVILSSNANKPEKDEIVLKIGTSNTHELTAENLQKADVAIEFTQPDAAIANILKCFEAGIPVVVGTTAWLDQLPAIKETCSKQNGALFFSPNFSIGVNIFFEINKKLATIMNRQPQYNVAMEEIHHTEKKDAPSGTAIKTAEVILEALSSKANWQLLDDNNVSSEALVIKAVREPNVPGTHIVQYESEVDSIQIIHEAKSRKGFAEGAVMAAKWLVGRKGVYEMKDMLQF